MAIWTKQKLGDVIYLEYGKGLIAEDRISGLYPVYGSSGKIGTHSEYLIKGPGIIVGRKGSVGEVHYSKNNFYPIDTTYFVRCKNKKYDIYFLYTLLKALNLKRLQGDTGVPGLNREIAYGEMISIPNLPTQTHIASVLSAYDDLIENNEKRIKALEEMSQLLYTEWFVNFKFSGHEKVKMVDSETEYGMIPEGWKIVTIGSMLGKVQRKAKIQTDEYLNIGKCPIVDQGKGFIAGYTDSDDAVYNQSLIVFGDHTRCFKYCNFPFACGADGTQLLLTNDIERIPEILLYYIVLNSGLQNFNYARHFKFLKTMKIIKPDSSIAKKFSELVDNTYEQITVFRNKNLILQKTRDLLISQLVTGKRKLK